MSMESFKSRMYPERPGMGVDESLATLEVPPEVVLSPEEEREIRSFEKQLTKEVEIGESGDGKKIEGLEGAWKLPITTTEFYPDYFVTEEGKQKLQAFFGLKELELETSEEATRALREQDYSRFTSDEQVKALESLAGYSRQYAEKKVLDQFAADNFGGVENIENPNRITIVRDPQTLATKLECYRKLKGHLKQEAEAVKKRDDPAAQARKVILEIHLRRVNELITEGYAPAKAALQQKNEPEVESRLRQSVRGDKLLMGQQAARSLARLDKFREGADPRREEDKQAEASDRDYSPLSSAAERLADLVSDYQAAPELTADHHFSDSDVENLREEKITSEEWVTWAETVLAKYDLLSQEKEYNPDRPGRAADGKWQVVRRAKGNLEVIPKQGVVAVPEKFDRPVASISPAGSVPVLDHEITHVFQHENKQRLGLAIMEKVGMGSTVNAEAGAIAAEAEAQEKLFGQRRPVNPHYVRAVQAKLGGGSFREVMKAFYDSSVAQDAKADPRKTAALAIDRASRLFRQGGEFEDRSGHVTNTQPLVYLEQELVAQKLNDKGMSKYLMIGGVDLTTLKKLHAVGLLDTSRMVVPEEAPSEIILEEVERKLR